MKTFLVLAFSGQDASDSKEHNHEGGMEDWAKWMQNYDGQIADMGSPLMNGVEGSKNDGFNEIKPDQWPAEGYMMIKAESIEAAQKMIKDSPLGDKMPIRIFEKAPMPEMG